MNQRIGTFKEFQAHTLAIARGDHEVGPDEPMVWSEPPVGQIPEEPDFRSEKELENAVAAAVEGILSQGSETVVLHGFGLDLAVFTERNGEPRSYFFEVEAFADHHGRCGFGNQRGEGNQIRLLFDGAREQPRSKSQLSLFDPTVRWVLGDCSQPIGSPRFLFFTCDEAQDAAMGSVKPGKQNNLRLSAFNESWLTWPALIKRIEEFTRG